jgi:hypothetical protein
MMERQYFYPYAVHDAKMSLRVSMVIFYITNRRFVSRLKVSKGLRVKILDVRSEQGEVMQNK